MSCWTTPTFSFPSFTAMYKTFHPDESRPMSMGSLVEILQDINEGIQHTDITTFIQNNCHNLSFVLVDGIVKLDSIDISSLLSHIPNFLGVYPSDCLPNIVDKSKSFGLVVNTDSSDKSGTHWLAIFVKNGICHYFDSFCGLPKVKNIRSFCEQFHSCHFNREKHQQIQEITCGAYCIFVINEMLFNNKSFRSVVSTFHRIKRDDVYVRKYLVSNFSYHLSTLHSELLSYVCSLQVLPNFSRRPRHAFD
ncbi:hypothetical protein PENTCL1PPCAC_25764 [Pristionchus entomophagus]|uniref:Peptidase n=1 Tax=Pristionchus entomophagus TaxID=358040 RepID=A0AAV5U9N9_9BILA|nr:hypothetical protein PENTCL1PPCAC_25763 [Pristionchus entomophagus]GMT03590.1 hypothetical protein PENTCL1PPCAC_25764 [Pristionchus entomophagus]